MKNNKKQRDRIIVLFVFIVIFVFSLIVFFIPVYKNYRIEEMKKEKILEEKREQLIANINSSVNEISELRENKAADDFDVASMNTDLSIEYSLNVNQQKAFLEIESALKRIENGTYGLCESCGEQISLERLKVNPEARLCISCKEQAEKQNRS